MTFSFWFSEHLEFDYKKQNKQVFHTQSRLTGRFSSLIVRKMYFKEFLQHKNINDHHNTTGLKSAPPQQATTLKWCLHDNKGDNNSKYVWADKMVDNSLHLRCNSCDTPGDLRTFQLCSKPWCLPEPDQDVFVPKPNREEEYINNINKRTA